MQSVLNLLTTYCFSPAVVNLKLGFYNISYHLKMCFSSGGGAITANTRHSITVGSIVVGPASQRWPNIEPTLGKCLVLAGI